MITEEGTYYWPGAGGIEGPNQFSTGKQYLDPNFSMNPQDYNLHNPNAPWVALALGPHSPYKYGQTIRLSNGKIGKFVDYGPGVKGFDVVSKRFFRGGPRIFGRGLLGGVIKNNPVARFARTGGLAGLAWRNIPKLWNGGDRPYPMATRVEQGYSPNPVASYNPGINPFASPTPTPLYTASNPYSNYNPGNMPPFGGEQLPPAPQNPIPGPAQDPAYMPDPIYQPGNPEAVAGNPAPYDELNPDPVDQYLPGDGQPGNGPGKSWKAMVAQKMGVPNLNVPNGYGGGGVFGPGSEGYGPGGYYNPGYLRAIGYEPGQGTGSLYAGGPMGGPTGGGGIGGQGGSFFGQLPGVRGGPLPGATFNLGASGGELPPTWQMNIGRSVLKQMLSGDPAARARQYAWESYQGNATGQPRRSWRDFNNVWDMWAQRGLPNGAAIGLPQWQQPSGVPIPGTPYLATSVVGGNFGKYSPNSNLMMGAGKGMAKTV